MTSPIYPCLWFDNQASEAAKFYCELFANSAITSDQPMAVHFELDGLKVMALNGGPQFSFTPAISMFVTCESDEEIDALWQKLSEGGKVFIPLGKYDWSDHYGWCGDRYGLTWQLYKGKMDDVKQKIVPSFLFANEQYGKADAAVKFYTSLFKDSEVQGIMYYGKDAPQPEGNVMHAQFLLDGGVYMAMDGVGDHQFGFNEAYSFVLECETQEEIDHYWTAITSEGEESRCGWCKDKFGVSWQIIPSDLKRLMDDPEKSQQVMRAFLKMTKFDLAALLAV